MKKRTKYIIGCLVFGNLGYYSFIHPEKYDILITIIIGMLFIISLAFLIAEEKTN